MELRECGRKRSWPTLRYICLQGLGDTKKLSVRKASLWVEISIQEFTNTKQDCYMFNAPLGNFIELIVK
jgi:hypothetical protein